MNAIDKKDRTVGAMLRVLQRDEVPVITSGGVVAQVWRDGSRQANLAKILSGVDVEAIDAARRSGANQRSAGHQSLAPNQKGTRAHTIRV